MFSVNLKPRSSNGASNTIPGHAGTFPPPCKSKPTRPASIAVQPSSRPPSTAGTPSAAAVPGPEVQYGRSGRCRLPASRTRPITFEVTRSLDQHRAVSTRGFRWRHRLGRSGYRPHCGRRPTSAARGVPAMALSVFSSSATSVGDLGHPRGLVGCVRGGGRQPGGRSHPGRRWPGRPTRREPGSSPGVGGAKRGPTGRSRRQRMTDGLMRVLFRVIIQVF